MTAISRQTFTGGITHVEARQMVIEAGRNRETLATKIHAAMPELSLDRAREIANQIYGTWEKANSGVTSDKQYKDNFAKLTGGMASSTGIPEHSRLQIPIRRARAPNQPLKPPLPS